MQVLLRMHEESQNKLEEQMRENTELRLRIKELEMTENVQITASAELAQP